MKTRPKIMLYVVIFSFATCICTIFLSCSRGSGFRYNSFDIAGYSAEGYQYSDREYFIFLEYPSINAESLRKVGFDEVPVSERLNHPLFETYPGNYGVGLDMRTSSSVMRKGDIYITLSNERVVIEVLNADKNFEIAQLENLIKDAERWLSSEAAVGSIDSAEGDQHEE